MSDTRLLQPSAASILQSMRDIGYTLDTAVADIIDNSIAASADKIELIFLENPTPHFLIIDNGVGMYDEELYDALRFATKSPVAARADEDLGRFGLGLKTASFSQSRRLTVISSKNSKISAARWDLDYVVEKDQWLLEILDPKDIRLDKEYLEKIKVHGTIVMWENLDRVLSGDKDTFSPRQVAGVLGKLREHLELVFHKFLEGKVFGKKISILLNNIELQPFDPFCLQNSFTQNQAQEKIVINDSIVTIQAFILPHFSKLDRSDYENFKKRSDFLNNQGAYVYRNHRLMVWGDWFRLIPKSEATKYARVQINFDKKIDDLWAIDIKKSKATPPLAVLERLKQVIGRISEASVRLSSRRVNKALETNEVPWNRFSGEYINYRINRNFPVYQKFKNSLSEEQRNNFNTLLEILESSLPVQSIYADMTSNPKQISLHENYDLEEMQEKFIAFADFMEAKQMQKHSFKQAALACGLFEKYSNNLEEWLEAYYA
ncbi:ATP-binding protein [Acinetobacter sp. 1239920]|uniref:ATP-binding protein n=1 Tax=Acinetobacter TaxID=469 RepID=UPI0004451425|nr:ATP-binding protein [Acinetobacter sp. 1239920]EXE56211.1 histidine kinase-, DNA gyrase B-, and HSP90-like ATPase family protein [Acinetobacter sp. 1239920]